MPCAACLCILRTQILHPVRSHFSQFVRLLFTLVALFYLRRYRHPLVLQLSGDPALLLHLLPEQLPEASRRLRQTQRLETVLSKTEVTRKSLDESIVFFGDTNAAEKAPWLARRVGFVLGRDKQGHYFYRVPLFRELILQDSPQAKLDVEIDSWKRSS